MTDLYYQCTPKSEAWLSIKAELDKLNAMITAGWAWGRRAGVPMAAPKPEKAPKRPKRSKDFKGGPKDSDLFGDDTDGGSRAGYDGDAGPTRMSYGDTINGFTRPGRDATAWRLFEGVWVPNKATKAGKALVKERAALPQVPDRAVWSEKLFKHGLVMGRENSGPRGSQGMCMRHATSGCRMRGTGKRRVFVAVIRMHSDVKKAAKRWPKGLVEITGSKAEKLVG